MNAPGNQRVSPVRVIQMLAVLLATWLGFQYWPDKKPPAPPLPAVQAESKLKAVGLTDNPDWAGLPEQFSVWAAKLEWSDNKTWFAYWNPGSGSYSYLFEATRRGTEYGFRQIGPVDLLPVGQDSYISSEGEIDEILGRRLESDTHPFIFIQRYTAEIHLYPYLPFDTKAKPPRPASQVEVDMKPTKLEVPKPTSLHPKAVNNEK